MKKSAQEKIADADMYGGRRLAKANEANERGHHERAERYYEKAQYWLDRVNKLLGNC